MVNSEFERIMLEHVFSIESKLSSSGEDMNHIKTELKEIKDNVKDLCDRTTTLEKTRDIKLAINDRNIKMLKGFAVGISAVFTAMQALRFLNII